MDVNVVVFSGAASHGNAGAAHLSEGCLPQTGVPFWLWASHVIHPFISRHICGFEHGEEPASIDTDGI